MEESWASTIVSKKSYIQIRSWLSSRATEAVCVFRDYFQKIWAPYSMCISILNVARHMLSKRAGILSASFCVTSFHLIFFVSACKATVYQDFLGVSGAYDVALLVRCLLRGCHGAISYLICRLRSTYL